jgi:hypothetical protein
VSALVVLPVHCAAIISSSRRKWQQQSSQQLAATTASKDPDRKRLGTERTRTEKQTQQLQNLEQLSSNSLEALHSFVSTGQEVSWIFILLNGLRCTAVLWNTIVLHCNRRQLTAAVGVMCVRCAAVA